VKYETSDNVYGGCKTCLVIVMDYLSSKIIGIAQHRCNWPSSDAPSSSEIMNIHEAVPKCKQSLSISVTISCKIGNVGPST
jgi:hypothetical protein